MLTQKDLDEIEQRLKDVFATKTEFLKHRIDLMNKLDKILKEILASREVQEVTGPRVSDHETRISKLEDLHPSGKHVFT